jgi:hypothetical protein
VIVAYNRKALESELMIQILLLVETVTNGDLITIPRSSATKQKKRRHNQAQNKVNPIRRGVAGVSDSDTPINHTGRRERKGHWSWRRDNGAGGSLGKFSRDLRFAGGGQYLMLPLLRKGCCHRGTGHCNLAVRGAVIDENLTFIRKNTTC